MESIGAKLQSARNEKGVTIEQVVRDTHITKRFIEAMEQEDFDQFPGEAYLLGFLRNYASYLGLNGEEIVTLYHNIRLQEQPAPIDELLDRKPRRRIPVGFIVGVIAIVAVAGIVTLFLTGVIRFPSRSQREQVTEESSDNDTLVLDEQFIERRFETGDRIGIPVDGRRAMIEFVEIGEQVAIGSEAGIVQLSLGERRILDITGEGSGDISVSIRRIYLDDGGEPALVARVDRVVEPIAANEPLPPELSDEDREDLSIGSTTEPSRQREPRVVAQFPTLQEYFIEADFRGMTMFRWEVDDKPREERYLQNGDRVRTSVADSIRLWASNAGNVRLRVAGNPVELGDQGEVVAAMIRWGETPAGGYQLELLPLY